MTTQMLTLLHNWCSPTYDDDDFSSDDMCCGCVRHVRRMTSNQAPKNTVCAASTTHPEPRGLGLQHGRTPSYSTGPSGDSSVDGTGAYMYVEASNNYPDVGPYTITTPVYTSCVGEVTFDYHMYGSSMGTLALEQMSSMTTRGRRSGPRPATRHCDTDASGGDSSRDCGD